MTHLDDGDTLHQWLRTLPDAGSACRTITLLRTALGGGGPVSAESAEYFHAGPRSVAAIERLCRDRALRGRVAAAGRILGASRIRAALRPARPRWTWWLASAGLAAASLAVLILAPRERPPVVESHRAPPLVTGDLRIVGVTEASSGDPRIVWHPVVGAEGYEVDVAGVDGRALLTTSTSDTTFVLTRGTLVPGARYFFRVRARIEVGRWIATDFRELRVR